MSTTENMTSGAVKGIAPYIAAGGLLLLIWLKRNDIAAWFGSAVGKPVTDAASGAYHAVTDPIVNAGKSAGQWWYETTSETYRQAQEDKAFFEMLMEQSTGSPVLDSIVASKGVDNWATGPFGLKMTILAQNSNTGLSGALPEQKDPAVTYTAEEMSNMSKGKTQDPGTGYVERGQSITGATLYEVGPWTKAGEVTVLDPSGAFSMEIWKNPIDGELTVRDGFGGQLSWSNFQRVERQYGRAYEVTWL